MNKKQFKRNADVAVFIPNMCLGGAERITLNLINELSIRGYLVQLIMLEKKGELLSRLNPSVELIDLKAAKIRNSIYPLLIYFLQNKPTAFLSSMWPLTIVAIISFCLFGKKTDTKLFLIEHTTWSRDEITQSYIGRSLVKYSMRVLYGLSERVIAVSKGVAEDLISFSGIKPSLITVIYNPVVPLRADSVSVPAPDYNEWAIGSHKKILSIGTLKPIKDYPTLFRAFALLSKKTEVKLLLLGEGPLREELKELAIELGIYNTVIMPGTVTNTTTYYRYADLFVLSSIGEGLPTVLIEALSEGIPIVSTDCKSGPREILSDGLYGKLVPISNPECLSDAMYESLQSTNDRELLIKRAKDFSISNSVDKYIKIFGLSHPN